MKPAAKAPGGGCGCLVLILIAVGLAIWWASRPASPGPSRPATNAAPATPAARAPAPAAGPSLAKREAKFQKDLPDLVEQVKQLRQEIRLGQSDQADTRLSYIKEQLASITDSALLNRPDVKELQKEVGVNESRLSVLRRTIDESDPAKDITVVRSSWSKGGFGTIAVWTVTLKNTNPVMRYSDIRYRTTYQAASGTGVGEGSGQILDIIGPGQTRTFEINDGFIHSQSRRASFAIVGAKQEITRPK
jgi:hypothetical protein